MTALRVVSLVPSVTDTLLSWGITPAACTRFCEHPELPHVGGTKNADVAAIQHLAPDLVIMDTEENRIEDFRALSATGIEILATSVRDIPSLNAAMRELSIRLDRQWEAVVTHEDTSSNVRCFVPIWRRPWMALGAPTYAHDLLARCGAENVMDSSGPYPAFSLEEARSLRPDIVLAPSEPYPFGARHIEELSYIGPTWCIDGKDLFWWGTRTHAALGRVRQLIESISL